MRKLPRHSQGNLGGVWVGLGRSLGQFGTEFGSVWGRSLGQFGAEFGSVWGGVWVSLGRSLGRFRAEFGSVWGGVWGLPTFTGFCTSRNVWREALSSGGKHCPLWGVGGS